ncbi:MAG TPA: hypothetical protein VNY36_08770 [Bacteroidia bacterium]|nr:hypothetical protein [Bacteroidia bacterium]
MGILIQIHSFLRWIVLLLLLAAIFKSLNGMMSKRAYAPSDNKISLFLLISAHIQLLVGLALYFMSTKVMFNEATMKNNVVRFLPLNILP